MSLSSSPAIWSAHFWAATTTFGEGYLLENPGAAERVYEVRPTI
jgi:hypothetical protein